MSARKAQRPDLALQPVRTQWVPKVGERVRRDDQTTHAAVIHGTADVLYVSRDGHTVTVARDPGPYGEPRWTEWPLSRVRRVSAAKASAAVTVSA